MRQGKRFALSALAGGLAVGAVVALAVPLTLAGSGETGDEWVSDEEYRSAADRYVACVEEAIPGVEASVTEDVRGKRTFNFVAYVGHDKEAQDDFASTIMDCEQEHFREVDLEWTRANTLDPELLQSAREVLGNCLREHDVDVPEVPTQADLGAVLEGVKDGSVSISAIEECTEEVEQELGLPNFFG